MKTIHNSAVYKYLDFIPCPKFLDTQTYDLVDEERSLKEDGRIPIVLVTQFGVFPQLGTYVEKPKHDFKDFEVFRHKTVGLVGMVYLSGREYQGIIPCYVDDMLIKKIKK